MATCPNHIDRKPSLSITETDKGVVLLKCWAGCVTSHVLEKLDLRYRDLFPSLYALQFSKRRPGGGIRFYTTGEKQSPEINEPSDEECAEWERSLWYWHAPTFAINQLADTLGLPAESLLALRVGYDADRVNWVFPEVDDRDRIVGLVRRTQLASKYAITGSRRGLTIPTNLDILANGSIHVVEGATDAASLISVDQCAIGRSSAKPSATQIQWLIRVLSKYAGPKLIVVGDRDLSGIGAEAARELSAYLHNTLNRDVSWALPRKGFKDVREQVINGKWSRGLSIQGGVK
jgi:hypothetical protein